MRRVRILVVDDHHMLREALVGMLEAAGFEVVGAVGDGADATSLAVELTPDVVLMDLSMPVLNGLDATRLLREVVPGVAIVIFSAFDSPELKRQAFDAGAVAYLPKGCGAERLRATVEAAVTLASGQLHRA
jgi:DNA-binding NarL/FixJ family response regulator